MKKEMIIFFGGALVVMACGYGIGYAHKSMVAFKDAQVALKDYQIDLKPSYQYKVPDSITLYQNNRMVGTVSLTYSEPFAELILSDNE